MYESPVTAHVLVLHFQHEDTFSRSILPVQLYGSTYSTDVCILVQQNILRILTAEIANLLRPAKLQSGVLKKFCKAIFGLWRLMLHATKLRLPNFYK
jgi:hypothetical protein|eukprot:COSAG01_NODE_1440_length_10297_cov_8.117572_11_plen_97_part_00